MYSFSCKKIKSVGVIVFSYARGLTNKHTQMHYLPGVEGNNRMMPVSTRKGLMLSCMSSTLTVFELISEHALIRLFANDVIMIGSVRADWPAPLSVTVGNPRADKHGRNGFECIGRRCLVDRERCVRATLMHSAIENYSMLHLQRWLECRGIKRFGTKSLFMIISHNCQSCMCRQ